MDSNYCLCASADEYHAHLFFACQLGVRWLRKFSDDQALLMPRRYFGIHSPAQIAEMDLYSLDMLLWRQKEELHVLPLLRLYT